MTRSVCHTACYGLALKGRLWSEATVYLPSCFTIQILLQMPVELKGSCHCGAVKFSLMSSTPVPYQASRWSRLMIVGVWF